MGGGERIGGGLGGDGAGGVGDGGSGSGGCCPMGNGGGFLVFAALESWMMMIEAPPKKAYGQTLEGLRPPAYGQPHEGPPADPQKLGLAWPFLLLRPHPLPPNGQRRRTICICYFLREWKVLAPSSLCVAACRVACRVLATV